MAIHKSIRLILLYWRQFLVFISIMNPQNSSHIRVVEALQSRNHNLQAPSNIVFKLLNQQSQLVYMKFEEAANNHPQAVIAYLAEHMAIKVLPKAEREKEGT